MYYSEISMKSCLMVDLKKGKLQHNIIIFTCDVFYRNVYGQLKFCRHMNEIPMDRTVSQISYDA